MSPISSKHREDDIHGNHSCVDEPTASPSGRNSLGGNKHHRRKSPGRYHRTYSESGYQQYQRAYSESVVKSRRKSRSKLHDSDDEIVVPRRRCVNGYRNLGLKVFAPNVGQPRPQSDTTACCDPESCVVPSEPGTSREVETNTLPYGGDISGENIVNRRRREQGQECPGRRAFPPDDRLLRDIESSSSAEDLNLDEGRSITEPSLPQTVVGGRRRRPSSIQPTKGAGGKPLDPRPLRTIESSSSAEDLDLDWGRSITEPSLPQPVVGGRRRRPSSIQPTKGAGGKALVPRPPSTPPARKGRRISDLELRDLLKRIGSLKPIDVPNTSQLIAKLKNENQADELRRAFGRRVAELIQLMPLDVLANAHDVLSSLPDKAMHFENDQGWRELLSDRLREIMLAVPKAGAPSEITTLSQIIIVAITHREKGIGNANLTEPALERIVCWVEQAHLAEIGENAALLGDVGVRDKSSKLEDALSKRVTTSIDNKSVCDFIEFQEVARVVNSLQAGGLNLFSDEALEDLVSDEIASCVKARCIRSWTEDRLRSEMESYSGLSLFCHSSEKVKRRAKVDIATRVAADICETLETFSEKDSVSCLQGKVDAWKKMTQGAMDADLMFVDEAWRARIFEAMAKIWNSSLTSLHLRQIEKMLEGMEDDILKLVNHGRRLVKGAWKKTGSTS